MKNQILIKKEVQETKADEYEICFFIEIWFYTIMLNKLWKIRNIDTKNLISSKHSTHLVLMENRTN